MDEILDLSQNFLLSKNYQDYKNSPPGYWLILQLTTKESLL